MATANELVRKYLNSVGVKDDQIGYDNKRNQVTVGGTDFYQPVKVEKGVSYGDTAGLNNAWNQYQQRQGQAKSNALMGQLSTALANPWTPEQFTYTAEDAEKDPAYQAALRTAASNAKVGTGNALAALNARGIDTSTVMGDRAAQIQQQEYGRVTDTVLPQLVSQAYSKWATEQGLKQNAQQSWISGLASLLGNQQGQNQQLIDNAANADAAAMNRKNANLNAALAVGSATGKNVLPQEDWTGLFRQAADGNTPLNLSGMQFSSAEDQRAFTNALSSQEFQENVRQFGLNYALQQAAQLLSQANTNIDNARASSNDAYGRYLDMWQLTGAAPADYPEYGIKKGDPYPGAAAAAKTPEYQGLSANQIYDAVKQRFTDPSSATGALLNDPTSKEKMYLQVGSAGLPQGQDDQVMVLLGLTPAEIAAFDKKYGVGGAPSGK